ncbi:DNA polymerase-3 subunit gamma/tau [Sphingomonas zeicaulis]|uniref:DNA polymerase III subunit gamma/tau n=1 Tax=Sphingomonas zeicaulis TaxID=1632740 RepID=UPI003D19654F
MSESQQPYRVLARKYRPQTFAELIGQDAMVTTLGNAIKRGRLAHAFLLTGVRGVGKTSTARLIAKALNCIGPDGQGGPTISPCGVCEPCIAIAEGRHIDVIEMDAASHTGVDDVREIIEASRYAAVSARYKVYIVDEVHMLSKNAFNALLKTLEEPPAHVKFLFATTEVNKVPVTVLSRCQRFDLRRIPAELLAEHFRRVVEAEGVVAEDEALALVARAAEGSARDGLSILDQAIAHAGLEGNAGVSAAQVRDMLGLSDRGAVRRLFGLLLAGDAPAALRLLNDQYDLGVDPVAVLRDLLGVVHGVTLVRVGVAADPAQSAEEREAFAGWAAQLSFASLHRLWQLMLKGHDEVTRAALPLEAAEMALLRVIHAAEMPDPGELAKRLLRGEMPHGLPPSGGTPGPGGGALPPTAPSAYTAAPPPPASAPEPSPPPPSGPPPWDQAPDGPPGWEEEQAPRASTPAPVQAAVPAEPAEPAGPALPADFPALVRLLGDGGKLQLQQQVHDYMGLVRFAPPELVLKPSRPVLPDFVRQLAEALKLITGTAWQVSLGEGQAEPTLLDQERMRETAARDAILAMPLVRATIEAFPEAELIHPYPAEARNGTL